MKEISKSFYERALELTKECKRVKNNNVYETLSKEFNIGVRTASDRFKSLFKMSVGEYIAYINKPSREVLRDAIIRCNSQEELLKYLDINYDWIKGLYDIYFKVSTFRKAKETLLNEVDVIEFNPTIEDNLSILISQHLGDGWIDYSRDSLKIEHCEKQFNYLKFKVNLIKKAFPVTKGLESIRKRDNQGYVSYIYNTNKIRHRYIEVIKKNSKKDLISKMTPFGWLLWYLDDGNLFISKNANHLSISISDVILKLEAQKVLETYGFNFSINKTGIIISDKFEIIKFINSFIKPYIHLIPECMKYKCIIKI